MKIVFTGGGSGGHFYPIIAIVQEIRNFVRENQLLDPQIYFLAPEPYNEEVLFNNNISYVKISAGKMRRYFSPLNITDSIKTIFGVLGAIWNVFWIYPDVIVCKGGFGSFPTVFAGVLLGIPIVVHESDSWPGRVNVWAGKFAKKIAVSYPDAIEAFKNKGKVAWTGNPIRDEIKQKSVEGAFNYLELDPSLKTILVLGGSQGAKIINDKISETIQELTKKYQVIHQTGEANFEEIKKLADISLTEPLYRDRYKIYSYLNDVAMKMSAGAASLVITRAGSTLFEIANWGVPSIIIPISDSNADHQRKNAYNYARSGAGTVIEENNFEPEVLIAEIDRILENPEVFNTMTEATKSFAKPDAGKVIAEAIMNIVLEHEK